MMYDITVICIDVDAIEDLEELNSDRLYQRSENEAAHLEWYDMTKAEALRIARGLREVLEDYTG